MFGSLASRVLRAYLRGIGGRLTRTLETHHARRGPAYRIALGVGDGDHSVVEAGVHMRHRSEEHTSELQSLMRISYAVFCLKKKKTTIEIITRDTTTHLINKHKDTVYDKT